jgi:hypothetical protein
MFLSIFNVHRPDTQYTIPMIEKYIQQLNEVRNNKIDVTAFHYKKAIDSEGYEYDQNGNKRHQLLTGLQFDYQPSDENLIRELLLQEITMHRNAPMQGLDPSLQLSCHLLSRYKNTQNVWLFVMAKTANFDTSCGLDYEYIVSAGIVATYDYVAKTTSKLKDAFYNIVGTSADTCHISPEDLETWEGYQQAQDKNFPETLSRQIHLAYSLGEHELAAEKLFQWKASQEIWKEEDLNMLSYFESLAKNIEGQIWAEERLLLLKKDDWMISVSLHRLAEHYVQIGNMDKAWEKIKALQPYLEKMSFWKEIELGRSIRETTLDIILGYGNPQHPSAIASHSWMMNTLGDIDLQGNQTRLEKVAKVRSLMKGQH